MFGAPFSGHHHADMDRSVSVRPAELNSPRSGFPFLTCQRRPKSTVTSLRRTLVTHFYTYLERARTWPAGRPAAIVHRPAAAMRAHRPAVRLRPADLGEQHLRFRLRQPQHLGQVHRPRGGGEQEVLAFDWMKHGDLQQEDRQSLPAVDSAGNHDVHDLFDLSGRVIWSAECWWRMLHNAGYPRVHRCLGDVCQKRGSASARGSGGIGCPFGRSLCGGVFCLYWTGRGRTADQGCRRRAKKRHGEAGAGADCRVSGSGREGGGAV